MKLWGSLSELVSLIFRKDSQQITVRPNQATTYTNARDIQLPPGDAAHVLTSANSTQTLTNKSIDADTNTITNIENADIKSGAAIDAAKIADGSVSSTEFQYIGGLTSDAQTQLNAKLDDFSSSNDNRLVRTDGTGGSAVQESAAVLSDAGALSGVTQLDVDNIRIDGNTVSSTSGDVNIDAGVSNAVSIVTANVLLRGGADLAFYDNDNSNAIVVSVPNDITTSRTPQIPDDTGNFVLDSATQTLTNKTLTSPVINTPTGITKSDVGLSNVDNTSNATERAAVATLTNKTLTAATVSDYLDVTEASSPSTPAGGRMRFYAKNDQKLYTKNSAGIEQEIGSGSGQGEKSYITNPSGASTFSPWTASSARFVAARTTTAAELPRENTTGTAITLSIPSGGNNGDYVYYDFSLDDVDLNRKLKIQWSQKSLSGYVAGNFQVYVAAQSDRTTPISGSTAFAIPANDYDMVLSFDTANVATLSLVVKLTGNLGARGIAISDVIVGPGQIVNATPIGAGETYTPDASINQGFGTIGVTELVYQQVGPFMIINGYFTPGTVAASQARLALPNGLTIGSPLTASTVVGKWARNTAVAAAGKQGVVLGAEGEGYLKFSLDDTGSAVNPLVAQNAISLFATGQVIQITNVRIPIAEWAGAPNYAGSNDVEYASVGGTWDADSSTTVYGPAGSAMGGALTAFRSKTITWQKSIQVGDTFQVQGSNDQINWVPLEGGVIANNTVSVISSMSTAGTAGTSAGFSFRHVSSTQSVIGFRRYAQIANDDSPVQEWPSSNAFFRVVKASAGSAVGFGAATQSSLGLVKAGQVPGTNTNDNAVAGNVGEFIESTGSTVSGIASGTVTNIHSQTLTAGDWDVWGFATFDHSSLDATSAKRNSIWISTISVASQAPYTSNYMLGNNLLHLTSGVRRVSISTTTTIYIVAQVNNLAGTAGTNRALTPTLYARRVR